MSIDDFVNYVHLYDAVTFLKLFPDNSIPLIITDPPYGIGYKSGYYKGKNPHAPITGDWNFQIEDFIREAYRVLAIDGAMYLFSRWDVVPLWLPSISSNHFKIKTKIVWMKNNWSSGDLTGSFGNQYEEMLFLTKDKHKIRGKRWSNIWQFPRIPAKQLLHPAQKPVELLERAVLASSDEGDIVLDPFCGSGSTGVAVIQNNRRYILSDIDKTSVEISKMRLGLTENSSQSIPEKKDCLTSYIFNHPDPLEWGLHPEELSFLVNELKMMNLDRNN